MEDNHVGTQRRDVLQITGDGFGHGLPAAGPAISAAAPTASVDAIAAAAGAGDRVGARHRREPAQGGSKGWAAEVSSGEGPRGDAATALKS